MTATIVKMAAANPEYGNSLPAFHPSDAKIGNKIPLYSGQTTSRLTTVTIPTHVVDDALIYSIDPIFNIPYARLDWGRYQRDRVEDRTYDLIVLENNYLELTILPELGGRIYQAIFKPTGNNIFYQNPVLKPSPWGPPEMGWWQAIGGMEWGLPVEEHGYEWGVPWSYQIIDLSDGVKVELRDTTANNRIRLKIAITLPDDTAFFQVSPTIENPTNQIIDYKFWLNAMLAPGPTNQVSPDLRIVMPADQVTVHSSGDSRLPEDWRVAGWPSHNGVDWSLLNNWREWYGFFQYPHAAGDFQAIYDERYDEGVVRVYDANVAEGAKFFAFGNGSRALSPEYYTDDISSYVEIHGGVAPTFADTHRLSAGSDITWDEFWYPVSGIGSLTWANQYVALHLEDTENGIQLHLAGSRRIEDVRAVLLQRSNNKIVYEIDQVTIEPDQPYHSPLIQQLDLTKNQIAVLVYKEDQLLGAYQYNGDPSLPSNPERGWQGELVRTTTFNGWFSIVRIWVRDQIGLPVTLAVNNGSWQVKGYTGTKAEYGPDALEFAPLAAASYIISPEGLNTNFRLELKPGTIADVVFEQNGASGPTSTPVATILPSPTPSITSTPSPIPAPTESPTVTLTPTATSTESPTPTPSPTSSPTQTVTATDAPDSTLEPILTITPEMSPTPLSTAITPSPTAKATATPTPTSGWHVQIPSNQVVSNNWFAVVRSSIQNQVGALIRITIVTDDTHPWTTVCRTGTKPEFGPDFCEFSPLIPGRYIVSPENADISATVEVARGGVAVVIFEQD